MRISYFPLHMRILILGIILLLGRLAPSEGAPLRFIQISDPHIGGGADHAERLSKTVTLINRLPFKISCVVLSGDLGRDNLDDPGQMAQLTNILGRLKVPVHAVPGNHDIPLKRFAASLQAYTNAFGPLLNRAEYQGVVFLFMFDEPLRTTDYQEKMPDFKPLNWLKTQLAAAQTNPVILVQHSPCVTDFYRNSMHSTWDEKNARRWTALVNDYHVSAVLAGHFHRDELHWAGDVPIYVAEPLAGYYNRQGAFRIYTWEDGHLSYNTVYLDEK